MQPNTSSENPQPCSDAGIEVGDMHTRSASLNIDRGYESTGMTSLVQPALETEASSTTVSSLRLAGKKESKRKADVETADPGVMVGLPNSSFIYRLQNGDISLTPRTVDGSRPEHNFSTLFIHPTLPNSRSNIRLLRMDPGPDASGASDLYCSLESVDPWNSRLQYECLSYCWGISTTGKQIFVRTADSDYRPMQVTENLHSALQGLKTSSKSTLYWIDAICIDQTNDTERGEQVGLMRDIYSKASGVVVWLGPGTTRLMAALDIINDMSRRFQADASISPDTIVGPSGLDLSEEDIAHLQSYTEYAYEDIAHFFTLPWFRRVWVLQEALSQPDITVRLGSYSLPWGSVILAALWQAQFTRTYTASSTADAGGQDSDQGFLPGLWLGLLHTRMPRGLSLIELASRARDFEATDPRDKVFALLGLANDLGPLDSRPSGLVPDYSKTAIEVYTEFARGLILKTCKLDVLSLVNTFPSPDGLHSFVSWMPNLDQPVATIRGFGFPEKYNACFSTTVDVHLARSLDDEPHILQLRGFQIDTVQFVTDSPLTFSRKLTLHLEHTTDAITHLWRTHLLPTTPNEMPERQRLQQYIELLTAAGFAQPTQFPAQPLGHIVPSRHIPSLVADFAAYWARLDPGFTDFSAPLAAKLQRLARSGDAHQFGVLAGKACHERKFLVTAQGRVGLCPQGTAVGDAVVVLRGGSVPYVLALGAAGREGRFVGECYVEGVMFGEAAGFGGEEVVFRIF
ncbi:hypothetical protein LEMA_P116360.1 [Plenodomus lingam JN3]|uniref:Heterokaryon incompatibility domain-containing protein n=1 Tax=Leptosphaeria maculans (strain JN3 / isolate v23.1.3 / race Av1-4-5-6-7-8) TaxID=985895 RepID=E4ZTS3_LEPMJ|nr:hypothetical protein LEMA_P116360.1 [Plenodomus lingam JN3]CBX94633.1 hypothetical protein LEMA_P116360.1 [Plenodomus lingam JN3]